MHRKITLIDGDEIISNDAKVAEKMNNFFSDAVSKLNIIGYQTEFSNTGHDKIYNSIQKFKEHPSILKIKQRIHINEKFTFPPCNAADITMLINNLNIYKPSAYNNIPAKIIVDTINICAPIISRIYNDYNNFPGSLKIFERIFERNMYKQISTYIDNYLSKYLCGFRKGSTMFNINAREVEESAG